jgi:hypothetical protein
MNVIDSSFWFEYYTESINVTNISETLEKMDEVIVPTIIIVEVFKKLLLVTSESNALKFIAQMKKGTLVPLILIYQLVLHFMAKNTNFH